MANSNPTCRRALALLEAETVARNLRADIAALEYKLVAVAPSLAAVAYADLRLLESDVAVIQCELKEVRDAR